jgi:transposase InsO family protein
MVVMDQYTRRIIGFAVQAGTLDGIAVCRMLNRIIGSSDNLPTYLSSDNDPLFRFHRWRANLRVLEVGEIKTVPYVPLSHPFVERLIGAIRREYLDQVLFWSARDLENQLNSFQDYYNAGRVHHALNGQTPDRMGIEKRTDVGNLNHYGWQSYCRGLFQLPVGA